MLLGKLSAGTGVAVEKSGNHLRRFAMKTLLILFGTLLISFSLFAQTNNYSLGGGNQPGTDTAPLSGQTPNATAPITSPVTGAPTLDTGAATTAVPPATVNTPSTDTTSAGVGTPAGSPTAIGTGAVSPTGSAAPIPPAAAPAGTPPATGTTQPAGSMMTPSGSGTTWQGI
jgi:hypothetical protein